MAVIDHRPFGGTCALCGCDPTKMLIAATEVIDDPQRMASKAVLGSPSIDLAALQKQKHKHRFTKLGHKVKPVRKTPTKASR